MPNAYTWLCLHERSTRVVAMGDQITHACITLLAACTNGPCVAISKSYIRTLRSEAPAGRSIDGTSLLSGAAGAGTYLAAPTDQRAWRVHTGAGSPYDLG